MEFEELTKLKNELANYRAMDEATLNILKEHDRIEQVYSSTAIEG